MAQGRATHVATISSLVRPPCGAAIAVLLLTLASGAALGQERAQELGTPSPTQEAAPLPPAGGLPPIPDAPAVPHSYSDAPSEPTRAPSLARRPTAVVTTEDSLGIPAATLTRLRALDRNFATLSVRGDNRVVNGVFSMLSGALSIAIGLLVNDDRLSTYLYLYGGAGVARGVVELTLVPDLAGPAIDFAHMPMNTVSEVRARLAFGESALEEMADRSRLARMVGAALDIGVGVAIVPLYLGPRDYALDSPIDYFVLIGAGVAVISGIVNLFTSTDAERRWSAYSEMRANLAARPSVSLRIRPLAAPGTLGAAASAAF